MITMTVTSMIWYDYYYYNYEDDDDDDEDDDDDDNLNPSCVFSFLLYHHQTVSWTTSPTVLHIYHQIGTLVPSKWNWSKLENGFIWSHFPLLKTFKTVYVHEMVPFLTRGEEQEMIL